MIEVEKEVFHFLSKDGKTKIHGVRWLPANGKVYAVLQLVHGMQEHIERYDEFASYMAKKGFLVVGHDHLGHGESVRSEDDLGYFASHKPSKTAVADMWQVTKITRNQYPDCPYFILGHSMGSFLLRRYLTLYSDAVNGAVICGTGSKPDYVTLFGMLVCKVIGLFRGEHYRSKFVSDSSFGKPYEAYDKTGLDPKNSWLSKNVESVEAYYKDPRCTFMFTVNGFYMLFSTIYYDNQMRNIRKIRKDLPVLFLAGEDDPVGDCGAGVRKACMQYKKAGIQSVSLRLYPEDRHEILQEPDREQVFADIYRWCRKRIKNTKR